MTTLPPIVALCGNPKAGKSTAAAVLTDELGYTLIDDGRFLRDIGINAFGLTEEDVSTQEGKSRVIVVNGAEMQVRELLGRIGNAFEAEFGADVIPEIALNKAREAPGRYVFGSVRREQGAFYKANGGVVIEVACPGVGPSEFEFDTFNPAHIDATINNPGATGDNQQQQLRSEVGRVIGALV